MSYSALGLAAAAAGWMALIFYFSSLPGPTSPVALSGADESRLLESVAVYWQGGLRSYAGHAVLYSVLTALIVAATWRWNLQIDMRWVIIATVLAILFGISDEYHQSFVIGRSATITDVLVDSVAAATSAALLWFLANTIVKSKKRLLHIPDKVTVGAH